MRSILSSTEYRRRLNCSAETSIAAEQPRSLSSALANADFDLGINGHPLAQKVYIEDAGGVDYDTQLQAVHDSGADWYRVDVLVVDSGQDFTRMDSLLSKAKAHGVKLLPILIPKVDRANDSPKTIYQKAHDEAYNFVQRYKNSIHVWELSNEEDNKSIRPRSGGGEHPSDFDDEKYAKSSAVLRGLSEGVHDADPSARRIIDFAGWTHTGFFERIENDHIPYEIVGVHWYGDQGEITCPGQSLPCPARPLHFNVIQRLRQITNDKPLWMTETNYRPNAGNAEQMEAYLSRVLQLYARSPQTYPFKVIFIYELLDEPDARGGPKETEMGLFSVNKTAQGKYRIGSSKPAYRVLQQRKPGMERTPE